MSLLRFAARTMLASFFVVNGVKSFRDPEPLVPAAEPIADKVLPLAEQVLPPAAAAYLPEDTKGLVRLSGLAQILGGISLATGIGRRLGAGVLAVSMLPHIVAGNPLKAPAAERSAARAILLRNVALTGGVLLAAQDTEGLPSLGWRARAQKEAMEKGAERLKAQIARDAAKAAKKAKSVARSAGKSIESALS
ncbi:MAG: DoxX family membrane protein [Micropruina sp.]|nr:MAG: DoxX family membrane protein [Micropruina sp.]